MKHYAVSLIIVSMFVALFVKSHDSVCSPLFGNFLIGDITEVISLRATFWGLD